MLRRLRLPITIVAALVVAEAAVFLFRPRAGPAPVAVAPQTYFSAAEIDRAEAFRNGQLALFGARLALEIGLLTWVVRRPPARLRASLSRPEGLAAGLPSSRPAIAGAGTAVALSVAVTVLTLPVSAIARERAKGVGLVTQSWVGWAGDVVKGVAIQAVLVGAGGALLMLAMRRVGRRWWAPAAAIAVAFGVVVTYAGPIVLDPVFNRFEPLPRGPLRSDVLELARRADVEVGEVYVMDASRRTTAANAYVAGLGRTKRVVLFDTLLKDFSPGEVRLVVAHELGHVHYRDVPSGLLYLLVVAPFGMLAVARLAERLAPAAVGTPAAVPAVALAIAIVVPAVTAVSNQLSRAVEARADRFAIELTRDPEELIAFQKRITVQNVADPAPPAWVHFLLGTHPTPMQRIGQALAFTDRPPAAAGAAPREGS